MKKNGFTLAEVLITLAIIGVVATMTLPALLNNTGEQQYITGLKKGINTLTEAAQLSQAIDNIDFSNLTGTEDPAEAPSAQLSAENPTMYALIASRVSVNPKTSADNRTNVPSAKAGLHNGNVAIFFRDGAAIYYNPGNYADGKDDAFTRTDDGLVGGLRIIYDVNGLKGPNVLSNCSGDVKGIEDAASPTGTVNPCNTTINRVIGDQFGVRLRGNIAVPNGNAARWAYEK